MEHSYASIAIACRANSRLTSLVYLLVSLCHGLACSDVPEHAQGYLFHHLFMLLMPAGVNVLEETNALSFILVNIIFLVGTFTFAVVLGVVSDDITTEVKVSRHQ